MDNKKPRKRITQRKEETTRSINKEQGNEKKIHKLSGGQVDKIYKIYQRCVCI